MMARMFFPFLAVTLNACGGAPFTTEGGPFDMTTTQAPAYTLASTGDDAATPIDPVAPIAPVAMAPTDASPDAGPVDMTPDASPTPEASLTPDAAPGLCCFVRGGIAYPCGTAITSCPVFGSCSEGGSLGTLGTCPAGGAK